MKQSEFRYNAQYPEPSENDTETEIFKWKTWNNDSELVEKDEETIRNKCVSKDKIRKLVSSFLSLGLQQDWN